MNRLLIGSGDKTHLLLDLMHRDFDAGFLLIDPTGTLAPLAANAIPKSHVQKTFLFEPDSSPVFNVLQAPLEDILTILFPEGASTLTRLKANHLLTTALDTLRQKHTLADVLTTVKDIFPEWDKKD